MIILSVWHAGVSTRQVHRTTKKRMKYKVTNNIKSKRNWWLVVPLGMVVATLEKLGINTRSTWAGEYRLPSYQILQHCILILFPFFLTHSFFMLKEWSLFLSQLKNCIKWYGNNWLHCVIVVQAVTNTLDLEDNLAT